MSPRYPTRKLTAKNETTPRKNGKNITSSMTPLSKKLNNLSLKSPSRKAHSNYSDESDKENYRDIENSGKKRKSCVSKSATKKLPFGLSNQENVMEDNTDIAFRTRSSTSRTPSKKSQATSSSPQKRKYLDGVLSSDTEDETYKAKSPLKKINLVPRRSSRLAPIEKVNFENTQKNESDNSVKSPRKSPFRSPSTRPTTSQRKQPTRLEDFETENHENKEDEKDESFELKDGSYDSDSSTKSVNSISTRTGRKKNEIKKNNVETFAEEPETSNIELFLRPVTKIELEVMKEDAERRAETRRKRENNPLMKVYPLFHTSALPDVLLKREEQCKEIKLFIQQAVNSKSSVHNRSIYISGVPGTGKTACVTKVVQELQSQKKAIKFHYVYVNGLELIKPQHIFSEIYSILYPSARAVASKTARDKLSKIFSFNDAKRIPILLAVDELDMLCTKSQDVVYDIFDWASTQESKLSVIAIANTLDLPERVLKQRISSRMGYNRITFNAYNFQEITDILKYRIGKSGASFKDNTFGLISRKVASYSGDLRKALELIRRSIEIAVDNGEETLMLKHAQAAIKEGEQSLPTLFTKSLSSHQECLLRSIVQEIRATSLEEFDFFLVYDCYHRNCLVMALEPMEMCSTAGLLSSLQTIGYINVKSHGLVSRRISLKTSIDDIESLLRQMKLSNES
uniref:Origin recognition complex subunit 1 n=1 Tax=Panagrolaimus superbus TaxID=310955 RepID=A0A914Z4P2_9BILA